MPTPESFSNRPEMATDLIVPNDDGQIMALEHTERRIAFSKLLPEVERLSQLTPPANKVSVHVLSKEDEENGGELRAFIYKYFHKDMGLSTRFVVNEDTVDENKDVLISVFDFLVFNEWDRIPFIGSREFVSSAGFPKEHDKFGPVIFHRKGKWCIVESPDYPVHSLTINPDLITDQEYIDYRVRAETLTDFLKQFDRDTLQNLG